MFIRLVGVEEQGRNKKGVFIGYKIINQRIHNLPVHDFFFNSFNFCQHIFLWI